MSYRFLLFDLDGTLLDGGRNIRARNRALLKRLMEQGVGVGIATGRPPRSARPYVEALALTGPLIFHNGCQVWDADRCLASATLERDVALQALRVARRHGAHVNLYVDDDIYIEERSPTSEASAAKDGVVQLPIGPLAEWLEARPEAPTKALFIHPPEAIAALERDLRPYTSERAALVRSEPDYLELLPSGVNKGSALALLCRQRGISPDEVVAFGDNLNDLELLARAGLGVAVGNAHPDLQEVADVVIGRHDTDAIAHFLERFIVTEGRLLRRQPMAVAPESSS